MCPQISHRLSWDRTWASAVRGRRPARSENNQLRSTVNNCGLLKTVLGPKRDEVTGEWRKLHNEELNDLYYSQHIIRVIKSRRMRWVGHVARVGERRGAYRVLVGNPEVNTPFRRPRRRWEDNLRWIFRKWDVGIWTGSSWLRIGTGGGHL